jgi:hypothetical protein
MTKNIFILLLSLTFLNSCYVIPAKSFNQNIRDRSFNMGFDKFHQQSMESNYFDSVYCNLNLVMETLAYYRTDLKELKFSNQGIQKVKDELLRSYDKYKSGDRTIFKSELELKEKVGDYLKNVIDDARIGGKQYEAKGILDLGPTKMRPKRN